MFKNCVYFLMVSVSYYFGLNQFKTEKNKKCVTKNNNNELNNIVL